MAIAISCGISSQTVFADKTVDMGKRGSVTIRYFDDVDARTPVEGAEFTFYKIDDSSDLTTYTDTTNQDGILKIRDMKLGRYRVVETSPSPGHKASASFLLTIPMTDHNEWIYDLTLEPKASLDLPTTSKSVYSVPGGTSIFSGSSYQGNNGNYSGSGFAASRYAKSETTQDETSQGRVFKKAAGAGTGDESCASLWTAVNALAGVLIAFLLRSRKRKTLTHERTVHSRH